MSNMFEGCSSLKELDLTYFNTDKVDDMSNMFAVISNFIFYNALFIIL